MQVTEKSTTVPILVGRLLIALAVVLVLSSLGVWAYTVFVPETAAHSSPVAQVKRPAAIPTPTDEIMAHKLAQAYMNAFLARNYTTMWSLLHPQIQAGWPNQENFAAFLQAHFQDYSLQNFSLGNSKHLDYWVNPETMTRYDNVEEISVSLTLSPKHPTAQLPPEDIQPGPLFQNLPLIVQHTTTASNGTNQWVVLVGGPADPEAPILPPVTPVSRVVQVPILMYHYITGVPGNDPNPLLRLSLSVAPTIFGQQLDQMKARGYHSITFNQLMNALYYGAPLPTKPVIFTFDDGYIDGYQSAYPILKAHGYTGMFYIITGKVGWQGQMTWPQMREMVANGMQMGSHTIHHVDIGQVFLNSQQEAQQELQISMSTLQQQLGIPIQHFCYPNGEPFKTGSQQLCQSIISLLAQDGYIDATTDPGATGIEQSNQNTLNLLRIRVDGRESLQQFMGSLPW